MANDEEKNTTLIPQIKPNFSSLNLSIIKPVIIGALKYPNKLKINWLILDDVAWQSFGTHEIIIPVAMGIIAAPKNKNDHNKADKYVILNINPIGSEKQKAKIPKAVHLCKALVSFFPLYPPYLSENVPPNNTPDKGAVILIIEKITLTIIGLVFNISITVSFNSIDLSYLFLIWRRILYL